jgi:predicted RNA-binding protein YlxR (DUF448 family)
MEGLIIDPPQARGRSAYLCPSVACLEKAWQRKVFQRAFRRDVAGLDATGIRERFEMDLRRRLIAG